MVIAPLVVGCVALVATGRALLIGSASAEGSGITREHEPLFYWLCIVGGMAAAVILFYIGLRGSGG